MTLGSQFTVVLTFSHKVAGRAVRLFSSVVPAAITVNVCVAYVQVSVRNGCSVKNWDTKFASQINVLASLTRLND